jgi:hypothetical protein
MTNIFCDNVRILYLSHNIKKSPKHWGKGDDRNCNYGHSKVADVESGKNLFC